MEWSRNLHRGGRIGRIQLNLEWNGRTVLFLLCICVCRRYIIGDRKSWQRNASGMFQESNQNMEMSCWFTAFRLHQLISIFKEACLYTLDQHQKTACHIFCNILAHIFHGILLSCIIHIKSHCVLRLQQLCIYIGDPDVLSENSCKE